MLIRARLAMMAGLILVLSSLSPLAANALTAETGADVYAGDMLDELPVLAPASTRYDRDLFAEGADEDGDGCRTRQEVLIQESTVEPVIGSNCSVSGQWLSAYDGVHSTDPGALEVDHVVALKEAWVSGAWAWTPAQRAAFANDLGDPRSLNAVTSASNQAKSDKDPAKWVPTEAAFQCTYISDWIAVKWRWNLAVDQAEKDALTSWLARCAEGSSAGPITTMVAPPAGGRPSDPVADSAPSPTSAPVSAVVPSAGTSSAIGTGAISIKGPSSELLPGVTVEIRKDSCDGPAVWLTTTTDRADAYGAFGIGLAAGSYCIKTLAVPGPYRLPANVMFTMEERPANWVTVWVPGPVIATGAVVAKNSNGVPINGVTVYIREGSCATDGPGVWQNTTAANRWAEGGFGISLATGTHCVTTLSVPSGYQKPGPFQADVVSPSPYWLTVWVPGTGPYVPPPTPPSNVSYANCAAVRAAGKAPIYRGQPGYAPHLDRDGDGVGCE